MTENVQNLPAGLQGRVAAAATQPAAPAPVPASPPIDQGPAVQPTPAPAAPATQPPATPPAPTSTPFSPPALAPIPDPKAAQPQPTQAPAQPPQVPTAAVEQSNATVAGLASAFANDSALAPAVGYMDAVLKEGGVDVTRALGNAADELDARFIDRHYLTEKLGAEKAAQVVKLAEDTIKYVRDYNGETFRQMHATAGNEAQFNVAVDAFNKTCQDDVERGLIVNALNSGDRTQMVWAAKRIAQYGVQAGVVIQHHTPPMGQAGTQQGLSKEEYAKAIQERGLTHERYEELKQLRRLGMQQGR